MLATKDDKKPVPPASWEAKVPDLPRAPGVYLFRDGQGRVLYVGKAKDLRSRVRSYTREQGDTRYSVQFLREKIADLEFIVTDTEKEALILENNLIKKYRPRYNLHLRDDKTYYHIRLTLAEDFPRLTLTRRPRKGGKDLLFGPFASSVSVKETVRMLQMIFPLRRCSERFRMRERPCLNYQIGKCLGPCAQKLTREEYGQVVNEVTRFLKGRRPELIRELKQRMGEAAEAEDFETAALLRDRVTAIEKTLEAQKVDSVKPVDRDVIGFYREGDRVVIHRLGFRGGVLLTSDSDGFSRVAQPDEEILASYLTQLYRERAEPPDEVMVPFAPADAELLQESFAEMKGRKCAVRAPERGEGRRLVEMAAKNAKESLTREAGKQEDRERAMEELRARLRLAKVPRWIECVDISVLGGENAVGSVIKFVDGDPDKSGYRRYKIKTVAGVNDYDMMHEVLTRRFRRALDEGLPLPDLLVVDGGKGQLNVARAVVKELGIEGLELAALAKDRETGDPLSERLEKKGERVFVPGAKDPVAIKPGTAGLFLLMRVRDEAHRFAVSYHKLLRQKRARRSSLTEIPGIGRKKAAALLKHFGGIRKLREAGAEEIAAAPGISKSDAERIKQFLEDRAGQDEDN
ncbi:MAG TPA: excinuclease ABC subunit UvrC [bacterium]|nr:excinuclease ABC subunit UvrC [bacterium]